VDETHLPEGINEDDPESSFMDQMLGKSFQPGYSREQRTQDLLHLSALNRNSRKQQAQISFTGSLGAYNSGSQDDTGRLYSRNYYHEELCRPLDIELFTLVRLSTLEHFEGSLVLDTLDKELPRREVLSVVELPDESWELVVLRSYLPKLVHRLGENLPGAHVDKTYDPCEPPEDNFLDILGYDGAKALRVYTFSVRARDLIRNAWPDAAAYYASYLEQLRVDDWSL